MLDYSEIDYKYSMSVLSLILDFRSKLNNSFNYKLRNLKFFNTPEGVFRIYKFLGDFFHFVPTCAPKELYFGVQNYETN